MIGTTSLNDKQKGLVYALSQRTLVFLAASFLPSVFFVIQGLKDMATCLADLNYLISVKEKHHVSKKDQPSATAKSLRFAVSPKDPENIQIQVQRVEHFVSQHEVNFSGKNDEIKFIHTVSDRSEIANWVIKIALWLYSVRKRDHLQHGLLGMADFLSIEKLNARLG
ncbi:MAG: hypothetical protein A4S09_16570 [Proteobacteria bacterium SG_bin7]|nr:MAG: hypothetical protein A4S09_16570 [Proteobacteria bacterium SG_bin7]